MKRLAVLLTFLVIYLFSSGCAEVVTPTITPSPYPTIRPSPALTELPAVNWRSSPLATPARIALPEVDRCRCDCAATPTPEPAGEVAIYDCAGERATPSWLTVRFGAVTWTRAAGGGRLAAVRACCGDCAAVHVVHVEDPAGAPVEGVPVVLHWPDAPLLPAELHACGLDRGVVGYTNAAGDVGFGLGGGAYYQVPQGGPHTVWVGNASDCLSGIGMLLYTNHEHVDSGWTIPASRAESIVAQDQVFQPGTLVYQEMIDGRSVPVIVWPELGWER